MAINFQRWVGFQRRLSKRKRNRVSRTYAAMRFVRGSSQPPPPAVVQTHYRRPADTIIEAPDGTVQIWNGIDKPLRFNAAIGTTETVGVTAPAGAMTLSSAGAGPIVGKFTSYCRFVDRDGNFSSLSPISNTIAPAVTVAVISGATNASPIVISTQTPHGISTNQIVKIAGVYGNNAANGIWVTGAVTSTTLTLLNGDGSNSTANGLYNSGGTVVTGAATLIYSNVPVPTESKVVRRQILRNKDGEGFVYYIDIDTTDLTTTTFFSSTTSQSLSNPVSLFDQNGETLVDKSLPLTFKKFAAAYLGRVFAAGTEPYTEGAVSVTNGSPIVTGVGTDWKPLTFPGRFLTVSGGDKTYTIQSVASPTQLTLTANYAGTTDPYSYYVINSGFSERRTLYWSEPGQPEAWPVTNMLTLAEDPGAGEFTGLMPMRSWLHILAESRIYRFSFVDNPLLDGYSVTASKRGCVNNRCWVQDEDTAYMLDYRGIHGFSGNDDQALGSSQIQDLFRPRQNGKYKINWNAKKSFHAIYDPADGTIRWFICLAGGTGPRHAIAFQVRFQRWWIEEYPFVVGASCLGRMAGRPQVFLGVEGKRIMALNASTLDGIDPGSGTVRGTVTSAGTTWLADSTATFPSLAGVRVAIVGGRGKDQSRMIVSSTATQLNVANPWLILPDSTSQYQVGGIRWKFVTGWKKWLASEHDTVRGVHLQFSPLAQQAATYLRVLSDFSFTGQAWGTTSSLADGNGVACLPNDPNTDLTIDMTKANGHISVKTEGGREPWTDAIRYVAVEVGGWSNAGQVQLQELKIDGVGGRQ